MKEIQYRTFSWRTHKRNLQLKKPNVCRFELTFGCGLRCKHCYTDCYNRPDYVKKELKTEEVKFVLDKVYKAGVIWIYFTGGDPLIRDDFLDIYTYAKGKGFIITILTSACSMTKEIIDYLKKRPPFVVEMTLNGVTKETYEVISQVKGSFDKAMGGLELILKANLPLKVKTQVTKENLYQISTIKKFIEDLGLEFRPALDLYARLNGDLTPCNLRISPEQLLSFNENKKRLINDCQSSPNTEDETAEGYKLNADMCASGTDGHGLHKTTLNNIQRSNGRKPNVDLFRCAVGGGDGVNVDPYGNMFLCNLIRKPVFNLLKVDVGYAADRLLPLVRGKKFTPAAKCNGCNLRELCFWCPGRALVETGDGEMPLRYYCELAHLTKRHLK